MIKTIIAAGFIVVMLTMTALAGDLPPFSNLAPVVATDVSRTAAEIGLLLKVARESEARAVYWEDACKSTSQCGGVAATNAK